MFICNIASVVTFSKTRNKEFKKLRRQVQGKRHIKIELCAKLSLLRLFHVDHVVQNRRSALSLAWHEWFHNERFTTASSRCRHNLKYENFTSSFARLRQNIAPKACCTCSTIIFLHSTNQIIDLWRCRWRCRRQILNSLMSVYYDIKRWPTEWYILEYCRRYIQFILILAKGVAFSPIHVAPGFYIVKSVDDEILTLKKLISVQRFLSFWTNCKTAK